MTTMTTMTILTAFAALSSLALAMPAHRRSVFAETGAVPFSAGSARIAGWFLVSVAFASSVLGYGWEIAAVFWLAALAVAGFGVTVVLAYRPRTLPVLAAGAFATAVTLSLL